MCCLTMHDEASLLMIRHIHVVCLFYWGDAMNMKKICPRCKVTLIDADQQCCDACASKRVERHHEYDKLRRNQKSKDFYHSPEWRHLAEHVKRKQGGMDLWSLYKEHRQVTTDLCVHHIVELNEDWSKRLDEDNLFVCSSRTHNIIHDLYRHGDKVATQNELKNILKKHHTLIS